MSASAETLLRIRSSFGIPTPSPEAARQKPDSICYLNSLLEQAGYERNISALTVPVLAQQMEDNRTSTPQTLTQEQMQAILLSAPGHVRIEVGQLEKPISVVEVGDRTRQLTDVTLLMSVEDLTQVADLMVPTWDIYSITPDGVIRFHGSQQ